MGAPTHVPTTPEKDCGVPIGGSRRGLVRDHPGLPSTPAQRTASRLKALRHGFYRREFLDEPARARMHRDWGIDDPQLLVRESVAIA